MKLLALLLLMTNLLVFAWIQWGQPAAQPVPAQLYPEKISLVDETTHPVPVIPLVPPASTPTPAPGSALPAAPILAPAASSSANQSTTSPPPATLVPASNAVQPAQKTPPTIDLTCLEWGPIPAKRSADAQLRLNRLKLGKRLIYHDVTANNGPYWVYYAPLPSRQAANNKMAELQGLGIKDISVVHSEEWQNAISMGLYSNQAIAKARVASMRKKGIVTQIEARGKTARVFTLNDLTADEHNLIGKIQADFGGPALKKTTCSSPPT